MKLLKKYWAVFVLTFLISMTVGYALYMNYENTKAFNKCMSQQSLDITRQDAIEEYCREIINQGGYRE